MESYLGCTPTSDYYQNRTTAQREHDLLTKRISFTELNDTMFCYQLIKIKKKFEKPTRRRSYVFIKVFPTQFLKSYKKS